MNPIKAMMAKIKGVRVRLSQFREMGGFTAVFHRFGTDAYRSELVRACIRTLANHTSKADPICTDKALEYMLRYRPNQFMNGTDFLRKVRSHYELYGTAFVIIFRDGKKIIGLYPLKCANIEALEDPTGNIYVRFITARGTYMFPWSDVIVLRKDYAEHDILGDDESTILNTLEMINLSNQSVANAVKSTANLRGVLKTTKGMINPKDLKEIRDQFVKDYMSIETGNGIGALDSTMDFVPTNLDPKITSFSTMKEFRENLFRYYGMNDDILTSKADPEKMQVFYESQIEPFLIAMSREATSKIYSAREIVFGNEVRFASSTIQFMSMKDKLALKDFIDRGAITPNTWNEIVGLPPVEGGDKPVRRLDTAPVDETAKSVKEPKEEEKEDE